MSDGYNSTLEVSENRISELEHRSIEFIPSEQKRENRKKLQLPRDIWNNYKRSNICIIGIPGDEKECEAEQLFEEIMTKNASNLSKDINRKNEPPREKPKEIYSKTYYN